MLKHIAPLGLLAGLLLSVPAAGQEPDRRSPADTLPAPPSEVADAVVDFVNDPRRMRYTGPLRIDSGRVVQQDIAVLEGGMEVAGRVEGSVVVVNGDVRLLAGSEITGDLLVVGGSVLGLAQGRVGGEIESYPGRLDYRRDEEGRIVRVRTQRTRGAGSGAAGADWGRSDFLITTGKSYNRVEGLPITFGPRIQTAGSNPLRLHALAIYRTESGLTLDTDRMGYYVRAEQFLGGRRALRVGATAHSMVEPIEEWHLSDLESGLATFILHQDYRDHYERKGGSGFVTYQPEGSSLSLTAEGRWESHRPLAVGSPWTLFGNTDDWRPQPLAASGDLGTVALQVAFDTRSTAADPSTGWLLRGRLEQALHSELARPEAFLDPVAGAPTPVDPRSYDRFTAGLLDLRRYNRVNPESRLNFRLVVGGALDGSPLPPQRQHALGGEGSLPGYDLFSLDCGARDQLVHRGSEGAFTAFYPEYGCDGFALFQAELRGKLDFRLRLDGAPWEDDREGLSLGWDMAPDWTVFVDTGRGWAFDDRPDTGLRVDAGVGLLVDRLGIFLATPLSGGHDGVNLFVRLGPRF